MRAEFRSRWSRFVTAVQVSKRNVKVEFEGLADGGSYYVTTDPAVIRELKNKCITGNDVFLFDEEIDIIPEAKKVAAVEVVEETAKKAIIVEEVTNITEAREYLKNAGVSYQKLNSPNAIRKQASELNVEFPNLK